MTSVGSRSEIYFTAPVSDVSGYFNVYVYDLLWQAFDSSDHLLGSVMLSKTSEPTPGGMNEYFLPFDGISKVVLSGYAMDYFSMDDLSFNPSAPVPEPSTVFLLCAGVAGAGLLRRFSARDPK